MRIVDEFWGRHPSWTRFLVAQSRWAHLDFVLKISENPETRRPSTKE